MKLVYKYLDKCLNTMSDIFMTPQRSMTAYAPLDYYIPHWCVAEQVMEEGVSSPAPPLLPPDPVFGDFDWNDNTPVLQPLQTSDQMVMVLFLHHRYF